MAPAPRATMHWRGDMVGKRLQLRLLRGTPFDKSLDGFNPCLTTRRRLIDFVKSPNLFKISTSIVVNTGSLVTMNPQLLVSLELVRVSGL